MKHIFVFLGLISSRKILQYVWVISLRFLVPHRHNTGLKKVSVHPRVAECTNVQTRVGGTHARHGANCISPVQQTRLTVD